MNIITQRLLHLHRCEEVTWSTLQLLLQIDPTLSSCYQLTPSQLHQKLQFQIPLEKIQSIYKNLQSVTIASMLEKYKSQNIQCITRFDSSYPSALKQIYNPPWVLYVKGNRDILLNNQMLAIVGTRTPTKYGVKITDYFVSSLVNHGWTTVSGLAKGIDARVHDTTIKQNGNTIAVLGSGFNHLYPRENLQLANEIIKENILLSEYPPERKPNRWQFPARNRIISGLSLGTIVIEAKAKSGSLITANLALEQNREVFAVPGPVDSVYSDGTNLLIQEGAKLALTPEDVLIEFQTQLPSETY
ncbi:DNA processing protein [Bacillus mesophilus]|uniref:DNA-protecting protein DprA n=1 Tax=Bacillus mesophilus TaxID=1808955 RepID=A0A6M0Q513_9BACI|nr:DNA-processing protein DprA [Bacillus mesophilus]MBM7659376.1 DNA processing protein [Bacillus mesophilus]NEY70248.1 DNA-protecting protein DprA [Bacillus mesophilus]